MHGVQANMTYKGIAKGRVIELEGGVVLPEGIEVEVVVRQSDEQAANGYSKGSPRAILAAFDIPSRCTPEDVDALLQAIEFGRRPLRFEGAFDRQERKK